MVESTYPRTRGVLIVSRSTKIAVASTAVGLLALGGGLSIAGQASAEVAAGGTGSRNQQSHLAVPIVAAAAKGRPAPVR